MAEEAFALSPISASAAVPTEADYHAIREAFMETARGRWFLTEYAKRNRNADTAMVLEAVARIEQSIGAAHQEAAASAPSEVLLEATLEKARAAIREQFTETGFDHTLLPWRKSARIIREIVWGLRESGADPRICNILDGQVRAIEAACDDFPLETIRDRMLAALDAAVSQDREAAPATVESAGGTHAAEAETKIMAEAAPAPAQAVEPEPQPKIAVAEPVITEPAVAAPAVVEAAAPAAIIEPVIAEPAIAETKAAMEASTPASPETAAPDIASAPNSEPEAAVHAEAAEPEPIAAVIELPQPEPAPAQSEPAPMAAAPRSIMTASASQPAPQPMAEPVPDETPAIATAASLPQVAPAAEPARESAMAAEAEGGGSEDLWADIEAEIAPLPPFDPVHEASLGASLIAQGVVVRPSNGRADLLAPIRRMSHAERIAFFS